MSRDTEQCLRFPCWLVVWGLYLVLATLFIPDSDLPLGGQGKPALSLLVRSQLGVLGNRK